jgi:hypothetical protein
MPNRRSPDAAMSPLELRALHYLGEGQQEVIADAHRELLVRMGLARVNGGGVLEITEDGMRRLAAEGLRTVNGQG